MESVGNVFVELYFHSGKQPCEFPDKLCCPLVSCRSRWCAGKGELFSCGVEPSGCVLGPAPLPRLLSPSPPGMGREGRCCTGLLQSTSLSTPCTGIPGQLGSGAGCGTGGTTETSLMSWAVRTGQVARHKYPQILQNCP